MGDTLYVNGRFYTQPLSGVQRFATEIARALMQHRAGRVVVLEPEGTRAKQPFIREVEGGSGQVWEQLELPRHTTDGMLVNLGNMAPLRRRSQRVVRLSDCPGDRDLGLDPDHIELRVLAR